MDQEAIDTVPRLMEEDYRGFNIIRLRGYIYAILQIEGSFDLQRFNKGDYNPSFAGTSVDQVKQAIDKARSSVLTSFKIFCRQKAHGLRNRLK